MRYQAIEDFMNALRQETLIIKRLLKYVDNHWNNHLSIKQFSDKSGMSPSKVSILFKKEIGYTIREYVSRKRIQQFQKLIGKSENSKAYCIAKELGFKSETQLYKWIKISSGKTYREHCGNKTVKLS